MLVALLLGFIGLLFAAMLALRWWPRLTLWALLILVGWTIPGAIFLHDPTLGRILWYGWCTAIVGLPVYWVIRNIHKSVKVWR